MTGKGKEVESIRIVLKVEVVERLKEFAINKYGRTYGTLSVICQEAIISYLDSQEHTHARTHAEPYYLDHSSKETNNITNTPNNTQKNKNNDTFTDEGNNGKSKNNTPESILHLRTISSIIMDQGGCETSELYPEYINKLIKREVGINEGTVRQYYNELKQYFIINEDGESFGIDIHGMKGDGLL